MPVSQPEVVDPRRYRLRHVGYSADLYPQGGAPAAITVLGKSLVPRELPVSHLPTSPDLVSGSYTGRLGDAGEFTLTFPNVVASDGVAWRNRFNPSGHTQFIEIYRNDLLEFVGVILAVQVDLGQVQVTGQDAWFLLKKAYEQDLTVVMGPRDVCEYYSRLPGPALVDDFLGSSLGGNWTGTNATTVVANGTVKVTQNANTFAKISAPVSPASTDWAITAILTATTADVISVLALNSASVATGSGAYVYWLRGSAIYVYETITGVNQQQGAIPEPKTLQLPVTLVLRRTGRWVTAYINGTFVGIVPWPSSVAANPTFVHLYQGQTTGQFATWDGVAMLDQRPFLQVSTDKGDYALPGTSATYPTGGLHGRYYQDQDLSGFAAYQDLTLSPARKTYSGGERLEPTINNPVPPNQAASPVYFSARWFGAVWLPLASRPGTWTFTVSNLDDGVRLYVGKTLYGQELIDDWGGGAAHTDTGSFTAASLGGRDAWYPIVVEYFQGGGGYGIVLSFTPPGANYVDAGGGTITGGSSQVIPATSLSPLGSVDQRFQGQSFFDIVQKTASDFGYQMTLEPMQLESGNFPGRLVPRIRVGRDTDVMLEVDTAQAAERIMSPQVTTDATDQVAITTGTSSGIADGTVGQATASVVSFSDVANDFFALQGWVDAGDIAFPSLLANRLASELTLRKSPWQNVTGDPRAPDRLADSFPLTGALAAMQWRPGDGIRLSLPQINLVDSSTRQILQVTREFGPEGYSKVSAGFRQRPRDDTRALRQQIRSALIPRRTYQKQYITINSQYQVESIPASPPGGTGYGAYVNLLATIPGSQLVRATILVSSVWGGNPPGVSLDIEINNNLRGAQLGGPWTWDPTKWGTTAAIDFTAFAFPVGSGGGNAFLRWHNQSTTTASPNIEWQLQAVLLV